MALYFWTGGIENIDHRFSLPVPLKSAKALGSSFRSWWLRLVTVLTSFVVSVVTTTDHYETGHACYVQAARKFSCVEANVRNVRMCAVFCYAASDVTADSGWHFQFCADHQRS